MERSAAADKFASIIALNSFWITAFNQANPGQFSRYIGSLQRFAGQQAMADFTAGRLRESKNCF
ncbi:hypothetical protein [Dyadobacter sp. CY261]|uniref:hypothetical protein n=1 Tax=Dyadobacter sp. CY261 TaxID=2907203 RepID=UPI002715159A|nr:hypothetical protein [Dyadobacter sp. CY261]